MTAETLGQVTSIPNVAGIYLHEAAMPVDYGVDPDEIPSAYEMRLHQNAIRLARMSLPDACVLCHDRQLTYVETEGIRGNLGAIALLNAAEARYDCAHEEKVAW